MDSPKIKVEKLLKYGNEKFGLNETSLRGVLDNASVGGGGGDNEKLLDIVHGTISEYIDNEKIVDYVGSYAFYSKPTLKSVSFPVCTSVYSNAFAYCYNLISIDFPACKTVSNNAFFMCSKLTNVNLPVCEVLSTAAFMSCPSLSEISLPRLKSAGQSIFANCKSLATAYLPVFNDSRASSVFASCTSLSQAYMPKVNSVPDYCFSGCTNLVDVNVQNCISVGQQAFRACSLLESIYAPYCYSANINAFYNCYKLSDVKFGLFGTVPSSCFAFCSSLKSFMFYARCSNGAFSGCNSLESVFVINASKSAASLGTSVFVNTPMSNSSYLGYYGSIYVPSSVVSVYKSATNWTAYSNRITEMPSEMNEKYIFAYEFMSSNITQVPAEKTNALGIGTYAFTGCSSLRDVNLPMCSFIAASAFAACGIRTLEAPNCQAIGDYAFSGCTSLYSANIVGCKKLSQYTFLYCSALKEMNLPECTSVPNICFSGCYSLSKIQIPKCESIGGSAFFKCSKLSMVVLGTDLSEPCIFSQSAFRDTPIASSSYLGYYGSIYVPDSLVSLYKVATNATVYASRFTGISNLPTT